MKMMLIALVAGALLAQNGPLPNGVYAIRAGKTGGKTVVVRQFEGKDLALDTSSYAPLSIVGEPAAGNGGLEVQLVPEAAKRLEDLTRANMSRPIAVVVGDKVLSAPVVRSVIKDGKALLTPCEDEACKTLLRQLSK